MKALEVLSYSMHEEVTHYVHPLSPEGHGSRQIFNHHLCEGKLHKQELLGLYVYHADTQFFCENRPDICGYICQDPQVIYKKY